MSLQSRKLTRTSSGRLVKAPEACLRWWMTRYGFLLGGGLVPYVLRPQLEGCLHMFVGEAYAHGIMHGEAVLKSCPSETDCEGELGRLKDVVLSGPDDIT